MFQRWIPSNINESEVGVRIRPVVYGSNEAGVVEWVKEGVLTTVRLDQRCMNAVNSSMRRGTVTDDY